MMLATRDKVPRLKEKGVYRFIRPPSVQDAVYSTRVLMFTDECEAIGGQEAGDSPQSILELITPIMEPVSRFVLRASVRCMETTSDGTSHKRMPTAWVSYTGAAVSSIRVKKVTSPTHETRPSEDMAFEDQMEDDQGDAVILPPHLMHQFPKTKHGLIRDSYWCVRITLKNGGPFTAAGLRNIPQSGGETSTMAKPSRMVKESPTLNLVFIGDRTVVLGDFPKLHDAMNILVPLPSGLWLGMYPEKLFLETEFGHTVPADKYECGLTAYVKLSFFEITESCSEADWRPSMNTTRRDVGKPLARVLC